MIAAGAEIMQKNNRVGSASIFLARTLSSSLQKGNQQQAQDETRDNDFEWSMKPLIIWLRLVGLDISYQSRNNALSNQIRRLLMLVFGLVLVTFSLSVNSVAYIVHSKEMAEGPLDQHQPNTTTTTSSLANGNKTASSSASASVAKQINTTISMINFLCYSAGVYVIFFVVVSCSSSWQHLWYNLKYNISQLIRQQQQLAIDADSNTTTVTIRSFYQRCRNLVLVSLLMFFIDCGINIYMAVDTFSHQQQQQQRQHGGSTSNSSDIYEFCKKISVSLSIAAEILPQSVITLFGVLVYLTSITFHYLHSEIVALLKQLNNHNNDESFVHHHALLMDDNNKNPVDADNAGIIFKVDDSTTVKAHSASHVLELWRRQHAAVCLFIHQLDGAFGLILLIAVCNTYVGFINISFEMALAFQDGGKVQSRFAILFIKQIIRTVVITYGPYLIRHEALKINRVLSEFRFQPDPHLQIKLNTVILETADACTIISACDFMDVNLTLFPSIVGTTLTYFIILYQQTRGM